MSARPRSALRPRYLRIHAVVVFLFLFAPIIVLVIFSFNSARSGTTWTGFSTKWYPDLLDNEAVKKAFEQHHQGRVGGDVRRDGARDARRVRPHTLPVPRPGRGSMLVFLSLVVPEVVMGIALLGLLPAARRRPARPEHGDPRAHHVLHRVRGRRRARPALRLRRHARGSGGRSRRDPVPGLRAHRAAARRAGHRGGRDARVRDLARRRRRSRSSRPARDRRRCRCTSSGRCGVASPPSINALSTIVLVFSLVLLAIGALVSARAAKKGAGGIDATTLG